MKGKPNDKITKENETCVHSSLSVLLIIYMYYCAYTESVISDYIDSLTDITRRSLLTAAAAAAVSISL